jgi:hypothetical protein
MITAAGSEVVEAGETIGPLVGCETVCPTDGGGLSADVGGLFSVTKFVLASTQIPAVLAHS